MWSLQYVFIILLCIPSELKLCTAFHSASIYNYFYFHSQGRRVIALTEEDVVRLRLLLGRLRAMFWLDAGHSGGCGAWVTDEDLLHCLASLRTEVHVHVTPQQVCDPNRCWIREEERDFVDKLRYYGAQVSETMHFENEERCLLNHFKVLNTF